MAGRLPILEHEEPHLYDALPHFSRRDQALIVLGLQLDEERLPKRVRVKKSPTAL